MMITTPTPQQTLNILPNRALDKNCSPTSAKMGSFSGSILVVRTGNGKNTKHHHILRDKKRPATFQQGDALEK